MDEPRPNQDKTYANLLARFLNYFLDDIFVTVLSVAGGFIFIIAFALVPPAIRKHLTLFNDYGFLILLIVVMLIILKFLYYFLSEYYLSKTPAKFITKTMVVTNKDKPGPKQIAIRTLSRFIPFDEISILFNQKTAWHDQLSGTYVAVAESNKGRKFGGRKVLARTILWVMGVLLATTVIWFGIRAVATNFGISIPLKPPIEAPVYLPGNIELKEVYVKKDVIEHHELHYVGDKTSFTYTQLTAGWQYNPSDNCTYTESTKIDGENVPIDNSLTCESISTVSSPSGRVEVFKIDTSPDTPTDVIEKTPEYYFAIAPQRYTIKFTEGSLRQDQIIRMAKSLTDHSKEELNGRTVDKTLLDE